MSKATHTRRIAPTPIATTEQSLRPTPNTPKHKIRRPLQPWEPSCRSSRGTCALYIDPVLPARKFVCVGHKGAKISSRIADSVTHSQASRRPEKYEVHISSGTKRLGQTSYHLLGLHDRKEQSYRAIIYSSYHRVGYHQHPSCPLKTRTIPTTHPAFGHSMARIIQTSFRHENKLVNP